MAAVRPPYLMIFGSTTQRVNCMKVLLIHNHYRFAGGEDGVVKAEQSLLKANGHQVSLLEVS
jgi:hypothetical protein